MAVCDTTPDTTKPPHGQHTRHSKINPRPPDPYGRGTPNARLSDCDPLIGQVVQASRSTAKRCERSGAAERVHVDMKKIGRIPDGGGW